MPCKTFLRVRNGDVASQRGVLGGSWTRLGSEARWTSQMPCSRVAIADWRFMKGASEAWERGCVCLEANQGTLRPGRQELDTTWQRGTMDQVR